MMTGDREKWDGSKPTDKSDQAETESKEKKPGDKGREFEGPSTGLEDAKHDGP